MKVKKSIDFTTLLEAKIFKNNSKEYKELDSLNDDGEWKDYCNKMLSKGVSVVYDAVGDYFLAKPVNENLNKMNKKQKKSLLEDDKKYLLFDDEDVEKDEEEEVEVLPGKDLDIESSVSDLTNIEDDIESFEDEMEEDDIEEEDVFASETPEPPSSDLVTMADINKIVDQIVSQRLGTSVNSSVEQQTPANDGLAASQNVVDLNVDPSRFITSNSEFNEIQDRVSTVIDKVENEASYLDELEGKAEPNQDTVSPGGVLVSPLSETSDLDNAVQSELGEENDFVCNGVLNYKGDKIQIKITGFVVTEPEVQELAESARKNNCKLRKIESKNEDKLSLIVESNNKFYRIDYKDSPYAVTATPWNIKNLKFGTLNEAFRAIKKNKKSVSNQERFLKHLLLKEKDLSRRQITNFKESEPFTKSQFPTWATKSVGIVNLKNGLNEVYSNITKHNPIVKNTLVKTKAGEYILLKGNLTEGKIGAKRHLVETKKDYGLVTVVGIYENSQRGLGQIMETIKRVAIPLMVWI